ncbi:MAG: peptidoglycan DD-metalloendopeptidase family protein [bacterium]
MNHRITYFLLLLAALVLSGGAFGRQQDKEIAKKERDLARLRTEIADYEKRLTESEKNERKTIDHIDNLEKQSNLIRSLIHRLRAEEQQITSEITEAKSSITELERHLGSLKEHYAKYVRSMYKYGRVYDLELLLSSKSLNQLSIRIEYFRRFSDQRSRDLKGITGKRDALERENTRLQSSLRNERQLLGEKNKEELLLSKKVSQRKNYLTSLKKDQLVYQQELNRKKSALKGVQKMIADLIEKERLRKETDLLASRDKPRSTGSSKLPSSPAREPAGTIAFQKGSLRWPVKSREILFPFGENTHPRMHTKTINSGIDIKVKSGSDVQAVADGEVSIVSFIAGLGNILILNHYSGYRTVYAHLSEVSVAEAEKVKAGQLIAKSGDSMEGAILHFEIWKEKDNQNPESWLAKR